MSKHISDVFDIIKVTNGWIVDETNNFKDFVASNNINVCRNNSINLKISNDIIMALTKLFCTEMIDASDGATEYRSINSVKEILAFVESILRGCQQIGRGYIQPGKCYKLLTEEKNLFKFVEKFNAFCFLEANNQLIYIEYILNDIYITSGDALEEIMTKKSILIFNSLLITGKIHSQIIT
jgi:hypothetical protein